MNEPTSQFAAELLQRNLSVAHDSFGAMRANVAHADKWSATTRMVREMIADGIDPSDPADRVAMQAWIDQYKARPRHERHRWPPVSGGGRARCTRTSGRGVVERQSLPQPVAVGIWPDALVLEPADDDAGVDPQVVGEHFDFVETANRSHDSSPVLRDQQIRGELIGSALLFGSVLGIAILLLDVDGSLRSVEDVLGLVEEREPEDVAPPEPEAQLNQRSAAAEPARRSVGSCSFDLVGNHNADTSGGALGDQGGVPDGRVGLAGESAGRRSALRETGWGSRERSRCGMPRSRPCVAKPR